MDWRIFTMKNSKDVNPETSKFVEQVMRDKGADASDLLEKIVRRKVEKHIRKTLKSAGGK